MLCAKFQAPKYGELRFMWEWCSEIGSCNACSAIFLVGASPVEPPGNLNMNKVLMLLVKQTAAGFNASREIFQPSHNVTLYDIDTPILSQLGIWFSNIFNDWEGNYCSWSNFVSWLVCPARFVFCSFPAFILRREKKAPKSDGLATCQDIDTWTMMFHTW